MTIMSYQRMERKIQIGRVIRESKMDREREKGEGGVLRECEKHRDSQRDMREMERDNENK